MPQKQKVSIETKVTIMQDYINGCIALCEAARRAGVSHKTMGQWMRTYELDGLDAFLPHKNRVYRSE